MSKAAARSRIRTDNKLTDIAAWIFSVAGMRAVSVEV